jgi:uncharacterized membrane protein
MLHFLSHLFSAVCGQNPGHTWAPGGLLLPCCERCTGLYVGAGLAAILHLCLRPKHRGRFLEMHGAFLLLMVPFGCHWVPQGPALRTAVGVLFGAGLVTFLSLPLAGYWRQEAHLAKAMAKGRERTSNLQQPAANIQGLHAGSPLDVGCSMLNVGGSRSSFSSCYFLVLGVTLLLLPLLAGLGGRLAAYALSACIAWGALALLALATADVGLALFWFLRRLRRLSSARLPA